MTLAVRNFGRLQVSHPKRQCERESSDDEVSSSDEDDCDNCRGTGRHLVEVPCSCGSKSHMCPVHMFFLTRKQISKGIWLGHFVTAYMRNSSWSETGTFMLL